MKQVIILFIFSILFLSSAWAASYNLNSYNRVIYVSTAGSDALGNGTESNPYATVYKAVDMASASGDAIYIKPGTYDVTNAGTSYGIDSGLNNKNKNVDFMGVSNETILYIHGENCSDRDIHFYSGKGFSKIYNMIFVRDSNNRGANYSDSFFGYGAVKGEIYNSVFKTLRCPSPSMTYNNSGPVEVKVYNSVFDLATNMVGSYSGANNAMQTINCVTNFSFANDANYYSNNLQNALFDANYNILSSGWQNTGIGLDADGTQANIGIYGGLNSWSQPVPEASNIILLLAGCFIVKMISKKK